MTHTTRLKKICFSIFIIIGFSLPYAVLYATDGVLVPSEEIVVPTDEVTPPLPPEVIVPPVDEVIPLPPEPHTVETILIRNENTVLYEGTFDFPEPGTISIADSAGVIHAVNTQSVLGVLYLLDEAHSEFSISQLPYYTSFGSFYIKCLLPEGGVEACDNWQYVVNSVTPYTSIDATQLTGGETIGLYFGSPYRVILDKTSVDQGGTVVASSEKYNYIDNTWSVRPGVTIGVTVPNLNDPYNPTVLTTYTVDNEGRATLTFPTVGIYTVGIAEDYYFPSYQVTVVVPIPEGGSSGGGGVIQNPSFNIVNALEYLARVQSPDGSFGGSDLYTDWASIALVAGGGNETIIQKSIAYMKTFTQPSTLLTDNERHVMALLALHQNPYSFGGVDYITPIVQSFDGVQFGDSTLVNDDIFALIPLSHVGYTINDELITKDIQFILSKQKQNGSWEESVDLTSAAIQSLSNFSSYDSVSSARARAGEYIASMQTGDGGWGNVSSTSWALQAASSLGTSWIASSKNGNDALAYAQLQDGGLLSDTESIQNRIWATSYAIPAILGKSWNTLLSNVPRPILPASSTPAPSLPMPLVDVPILVSVPTTPSPLKDIVVENVKKDILIKHKIIKDIKAPEKKVNIEEVENAPASLLLATPLKSKTTLPVRPLVLLGGAFFIGIIVRFVVFKK